MPLLNHCGKKSSIFDILGLYHTGLENFLFSSGEFTLNKHAQVCKASFQTVFVMFCARFLGQIEPKYFNLIGFLMQCSPKVFHIGVITQQSFDPRDFEAGYESIYIGHFLGLLLDSFVLVLLNLFCLVYNPI